MKSTSHGISMWRMRSERKKTAPLSTPDEQQVAVGVVGADLLPERRDALLELVGLDEDLADLGVAHLAADYMKPSAMQHPGLRRGS